ncbi:MAG TPA: enoyl-CoA hydratase-related protein, partial [Methylomirabilota bacterium]|nr:enoyl-CoA hydratase-related protein [Methylomirabilota bacterium]
MLRLERTGPGGVVARVTLTRPDVHNAFNASVIAELRTTFAALARDGPTDLRAVVLAGDGPSFCAGADIDWMRAAMTLDVEGNEQDAMAMAASPELPSSTFNRALGHRILPNLTDR